MPPAVADRSNRADEHRCRFGPCSKGGWRQTTGGSGLSDALTILGAAGIVIPAFARLRIRPVIGFILVGVIAGPFALGALAPHHPGSTFLDQRPAQDRAVRRARHHPAAVFGGLHISFRRLRSMRRAVFGVGAAELIGCAVLIGAACSSTGSPIAAAVALGLALALSSTALVLPISGIERPVGKASLRDAAVRRSRAWCR